MAIVQGNQSIDFVNFSRGVAPTIVVGSATTLTVEESGCVILVSNASAYTITLPAPSAEIAGCTYTFIQNTAAAAFTVLIDCGANNCIGTAVRAGADTASGTGVQYAKFLTGASQNGDCITLVCDGDIWLGFGYTSNAAGIEFND
jgi:hypothetical protein